MSPVSPSSSQFCVHHGNQTLAEASSSYPRSTVFLYTLIIWNVASVGYSNRTFTKEWKPCPPARKPLQPWGFANIYRCALNESTLSKEYGWNKTSAPILYLLINCLPSPRLCAGPFYPFSVSFIFFTPNVCNINICISYLDSHWCLSDCCCVCTCVSVSINRATTPTTTNKSVEY